MMLIPCRYFFFFTDPATTEIYTFSLHDALPIFIIVATFPRSIGAAPSTVPQWSTAGAGLDRKSTRLNSSHTVISYAVFCLKKKKKQRHPPLHVWPDVDAYRLRRVYNRVSCRLLA